MQFVGAEIFYILTAYGASQKMYEQAYVENCRQCHGCLYKQKWARSGVSHMKSCMRWSPRLHSYVCHLIVLTREVNPWSDPSKALLHLQRYGAVRSALPAGGAILWNSNQTWTSLLFNKSDGTHSSIKQSWTQSCVKERQRKCSLVHTQQWYI